MTHVFPLLLALAVPVAPSLDSVPTPTVAVDAFLVCRTEAYGYVLHFRVANAGTILPWAPGMLSLELDLRSADGTSIPSIAPMAHGSGRVEIAPGQEAFGELALSVVYREEELERLLSQGDATLRWRYVLADDVRREGFEGSVELLGTEFYERCKQGLPPSRQRE
jgi:hypothetical protein